MLQDMKLKYLFLTGILAMTALTACVNEGLQSEQNEQNVQQGAAKGRMALNVTKLDPAATRAQYEVTDFPVTLFNAEGQQVTSWNRVDEVPANYVLSVGSYIVESHTPGAIQKRMSYPYYKGTADVEIQKDVTTNVTVVCKMQNSSITVNYDADFLSVFSEWGITLDDGSSNSTTALSFTNADGTSPATVYWLFEQEQVSQLTLQFRGKTQNGSTVSARNVLTKQQATQQYDNDSPYFGGGDAIVINFTPVESTSGNVTGITINATVTFSETNQTVTLEVTDNGFSDPGNNTGNDPGNNPGDDPSNVPITLNLPNNMTVSASTEKSLGDTYIKCDNGIKSIKVSIESTSDEMIESLGDLNTNYGVDFIHGAEIVDNQSVVQLFNDLNQPLSVPAQGDIDYTFPIGNFFGLLGFLSGQHTFNMVVEDMNGAKKNGTLTLTVE